ncbi:uncharacterized protein OCT59_019388 [Rhizophagus irregularis]|uniref:uncharacterized protein n=1 Tax=Rhizophagus irregularis TaxID=588596 RepID=UPI00332A8C16|nr:hypothetical protein OCT59_019388 [Rhizophagus irregularis]
MFQTSLKKYKRKFCFLYLSLILHNCASEGSTCCSRSIWSTCWANNGIALLRGQRAVQELKLNVKAVDQNYIGTKLYDEKEKEISRFRSIETPSWSTCCSRSIWSTCWANNGIALLRGQRAVQELKLNVKAVDQNYIGTKLYDEKEKEISRFRSIETPSWSTCCSRSIWSTCWANNGIALLRGQRAVQELKLNVKAVDQNYIGTKLYDEKEKEISRFRSIETPSCESYESRTNSCSRQGQRAVQEVSGQRAELPIDLPIIFFITHILQLLTSLYLYIFKRLKLNVKTVDQNYIGTKLYDEKEKERSRFRCIETPSCESETDHLKKCARDNNAINELLIISSNLSGKDRSNIE